MKSTKVLYLTLNIIFVFILIIYLGTNFSNKREIYKDETKTKSYNQSISMLYETSSGSGVYEESKETNWPTEGYTFNSTLSKCEQGSALSWNEDYKKVIMKGNTSDKCYVYFDAPVLIANYIKTKVYIGTQGENNIYYHNNLANSAEDNSYRYSGAYESVENYVCFGSDAEKCPWDNMYRIIGVFGDNVKLIKADYAKTSELGTEGSYLKTYKEYEGTKNLGTNKGSNTKEEIGTYNAQEYEEDFIIQWDKTKLSTINLNDIFLNKFNSKWQQKILVHNWENGDFVLPVQPTEDLTPKDIYNYENNGYSFNAKIGAMQISDYGFAATPDAWKTSMVFSNYGEHKNINWLYGGLVELTYTLSPDTTYETIWGISYNGEINTDCGKAIRPCFYLNSDVKLIKGSGTQSDPYIIS